MLGSSSYTNFIPCTLLRVYLPTPSRRRGRSVLWQGKTYAYLFGSYLVEVAPGCWLSLSTSGGACPSSLSDALVDESSSRGSHGGVEIGSDGPFDTRKSSFTAPSAGELQPRAPTFLLRSLLASFLLQLQLLLLATERLFPRHRAASYQQRKRKGEIPKLIHCPIKTRGNPYVKRVLRMPAVGDYLGLFFLWFIDCSYILQSTVGTAF